MKQEIMANLENHGQLEKMYRNDKAAFKRTFNQIYAEIKENTAARIWNQRLNFESDEISWGTGRELAFVAVASFLAGLIAKIPDFTAVPAEFFYSRNLAFVVFPVLTAYFCWKRKLGSRKLILISAATLVSAAYINLLPQNDKSDTLVLACIHLPLFLWAVLGFAYTGDQPHDYGRRSDFLRYNGDLVVMTAIILLAGGLLTGITIGLFSLLDLNIEAFYFKYVGIWGLSAAPVVGTYLVQANPQLVGKVSPVIARVFTPLVLVILLLYLAAVIYTGKDPYNDRDFLIVFNVLLIGVMALILFSVVETSKNAGDGMGTLVLLGLAVVTIAVNGIALSAIVFRVSEWGTTPNRLAVLGGNLLMLANLVWVARKLLGAARGRAQMGGVEAGIAFFLPIYSLWTVLVAFVFPVLFNFK